MHLTGTAISERPPILPLPQPHRGKNTNTMRAVAFNFQEISRAQPHSERIRPPRQGESRLQIPHRQPERCTAHASSSSHRSHSDSGDEHRDHIFAWAHRQRCVDTGKANAPAQYAQLRPPERSLCCLPPPTEHASTCRRRVSARIQPPHRLKNLERLSAGPLVRMTNVEDVRQSSGNPGNSPPRFHDERGKLRNRIMAFAL